MTNPPPVEHNHVLVMDDRAAVGAPPDTAAAPPSFLLFLAVFRRRTSYHTRSIPVGGVLACMYVTPCKQNLVPPDYHDNDAYFSNFPPSLFTL